LFCTGARVCSTEYIYGVIKRFNHFVFRGRPELKDPSAKLCIDNKPHCCLHPTAGTTSYSSQATANGTAGVKLSSTTDRMARETTKTTTTAFSPKQTYWQSAKLCLQSGYQRIIYGGQRVKYGCQRVKSKVGSPLSWVASFFKRTASKTNKDGTSAVPWRRVSYSDSTGPLASNSTNQSSSTIPRPPPPPPSSADAQTWSSKFAQMGMSWVSKDKKPKPAESPKGKVVGGFTVTTTTTSPVGTTRTESTTETSYAPVADNIAAGRKLSQTDQFESNSLHQSRSKRTDAAQFTFLTKQPKEPSFTESTFLKSTSTPSTPATPASAPFARQPSIPEPEIQFPVYSNHQPQYARQQQQNTDSISSTARWKSPEPFKRAETVTAATGSRRSSGSYAEQSAASDSQALLMGRSVYTPVFEAEQMRPVINRRSSATPAPSESRASQASHYSTRSSRPYTRASTVEPRSFEKATIAAEHQKYLSNAQFEMSRANGLDNSTSPVQAVTRQWPPPSNASGPEIVKDLWMANSVSMMEPMELDPMMDPKAMAQSWHAEFATGQQPIVSNHIVSTSKSERQLVNRMSGSSVSGSYRQSLYDKVRACQTIARSLTSPPPLVNSRGRRVFERRKERVARMRRAQGHSPDPTDAASESDVRPSGP
jgi:hypothetical protein